MDKCEVQANFWYGASRYPVHEGQAEELKAIFLAGLNEMTTKAMPLMEKWCGGHKLPIEIANLTIVGDGFNIEFTLGEPEWYVTQALRETVEGN